MVLAFAVSASAAVQTIGSIKADVPDGWTTQEQGPIAVIIAPDQQSVVTVAVGPAQGQTAKAIAETGSKSINGTDLKADGDAWTFNFAQSGQTGSMLVRVVNDQAYVVSMIGDNPALKAIARSIQPK